MHKHISVLAALVLAASVLTGQASGGPTAGGLATDNIEHVKHIPLAQNGVGGRLIGKYFYMNDQNKVMVWDVSDPENPEMIGQVLMPQEWQFSREDIDGNGKILVVPNTLSGQNDGNPQTASPANAVYIIDVEDKTNPQIISKLPGAAQHTVSCVLNCKWAYGSGGNIIDLRDPAKPKLMEKKWGEGTPGGSSGHDVEEVAPGLVMTATDPMMLLDARKDPANPKVISAAERANQYQHGIRWPRKMGDRFLLAASETTMNGRCSDRSGSFQTWDTRGWKTKGFRFIDEHRPVNGTIIDGNPVAQRNCTAHWIEEHPKFKNGGFVAAGFYDHGTRFFEVTKTGEIKEAGYFMAYAGQASAAYWITNEIVYTVDYNRGLDILRFSPPKG
ncbi:MAG: LVIVD repeat-containing protein [Actinomycetota bacterium]